MTKAVRIIFSTVVLTLFYFVWTRNTNTTDLLVTAGLAFIVSLIYRNYLRSPIFHPKKIAYAVFSMCSFFLSK
jgi:multisubunit Na+/H+ antiporter MnhE subunit